MNRFTSIMRNLETYRFWNPLANLSSPDAVATALRTGAYHKDNRILSRLAHICEQSRLITCSWHFPHQRRNRSAGFNHVIRANAMEIQHYAGQEERLLAAESRSAPRQLDTSSSIRNQLITGRVSPRQMMKIVYIHDGMQQRVTVPDQDAKPMQSGDKS